jgi:hypothetical protein
VSKGYNIRFNRYLYRRYVMRQLRNFCIAAPLSIFAISFVFYGAVRWQLPLWVIIPVLVIAVYFLVASGYLFVESALDYWMTHGRTRKKDE